jgi:V/A-type H+-transporting ATPase subunit I
MIKTWSFLGILLGISTTIAGFLMNSFFGDFIPRFIGRPIYSATIFGIKLPLEPLEDPLTILAIALVFGIIHMNLGVILGIIQSFHRRDFKSLITNHFAWIPLQIGGGMLVGNFLMGWTIEGYLFYLAAALTLIGLFLLFIHAGPIGFFSITGYVGDWLSYARLLALGLATAGMALAFNVVSELIGGMIPVVGGVIMAIILIFSHIINLALQALGAGVHSLRLQYVEFFNRFYEGGGRQFSPFKMKRKYTKIEEKIK